jgi:cephalosporin-C deacetylase
MELIIMPLIDMPIEQLRKYKGSSPCPKDIDKYWSQAIAEMKTIEPNIELRPANFQAPFASCFDMYFTGVGGARVYAKLLRPKNIAKKKHPAVVMFHGYSGNSGDWQDKLGYVAAGFTVAALDCRGQSGKSEDNSSAIGSTFRGHIIRGLDAGAEHLLFRRIYLDCAQLAGLVMNMPGVDPTKVGAMGGSQGGALTIACASLEPRINRAAVLYPFLSDFRRVWDMDLCVDAYSELRDYFRWYDPMHSREAEVFNRLGYIDIQNIAKRIHGNVLMVTGLMDKICPPSTQFAVYNKITASKDIIIYPDFGHEGLPGINDTVFKYMLEMLK